MVCGARHARRVELCGVRDRHVGWCHSRGMTVVETNVRDLEEQVRVAVIGLLRDGPRDRGYVVEMLRGAVLEDPEEAEDWLDSIVSWDPDFVGVGERLGYAPVLFDGLVVCHRLTASDLDEGRVCLERSLGTLDWGAARDELTVNGRGCELHGSHLIGPEGWLEGAEIGQLLALRRQGSTVVVEREPRLEDGEREAAGMVAAAQELGAEHGLEIAPMMAEAMLADPSLFRRPVLPIAELLWSWGMERRRHVWGFSDWIWRPWFASGDDRAAGLERRLAAFEDRVCSDLEGVGELADAALDELFAVAGAHDAATVTALAATRSVTEIARRVLEASLAERAGDPNTARQHLEEVWSAAEPTGVGARLADYAFWAGDFDQAASLAGTVGSELVARASQRLLDRFRDAARRTPRNAACRCDSGRKFKHCCLRAGGPPLGVAEHAALVRAKLAIACGGVLVPGILGEQMAIEQARTLGEADKLSALLPQVEQSILAEALHEPVRVWEVLSADAHGVHVRSGDQTVDLHGVTAKPGDVALMRVLAQHQIVYGTGEVIDPDDVDDLIDLLGHNPRSADLDAALSALT